jgi:hypothetical protein
MAYNSFESKEDKERKIKKDLQRQEFMTPDEMVEADENITRLNSNRGYMSKLYSRWSIEDKSYRNDQDIVPNRPNTRVAIMNAIIESQVASLVDKNIAVTCKGEGVSDESFANWGKVGLEWTLRKNKFKKVLAVEERRRSLHGVGIFKTFFNPDALHGFGLTEITAVPLNKIFIDTKVKDPLKFQSAEYVAETISLGKQQLEEIYGYEKAQVIDLGNHAYEDTDTFNEDEAYYDDENSATVIQWWSRHKGTLRLREFTGCGLLLYDSHKNGDRDTNQKDSEYNHEPYYRYVNNKYPFFFTDMYPEEGTIWGIGDGTLLNPLQDMLNDLYDKIRMSARPNLILVDVDSEIDLEDFDENSLEPRPAILSRGTAVQSIQWGNINESWWRLLVQIHQEIQRVARTSYMMLGQGGGSDSATEAAIQQQQGAGAIDHKKLMLQETLIEMCEYILALMMEYYTEAKTFRISEEKKDYEWIDFRELTNVPTMIPATEEYKKKFREKNSDKEVPEWMVLTDEKGKPVTKNVDFDIQISIGAGLPQNKAFIYQMIEKLSGVVIDGQNVVHYAEMRKFIKDFLGIPLSDSDDQLMQQMAEQQGQQGMVPPQTGGPTQSAATEGLTQKNRPQMSKLPLSNTGGGLSGG